AGSTVVGLDGATGKQRWRGEGPGEPQALLDTPDATDPPRILWRSDWRIPASVTVCRLALPVGADGRYVVAAPSPEEYPPPIPAPGRSRPLPGPCRVHPGGGLGVPPPRFLSLLGCPRAWPPCLFLLGGVVGGPVVAGGTWPASDRRYLDEAQHYAWAG